jgi:short-subunit dehydrogenase
MRDGPVIIVTGASSGIGEATACLFAARGWAVVLAARSAGELQRVMNDICAAGGTALSVPTDVTQPVDRARLVAATLETFGRVDALVNNAGMGISGTIDTLDLGDLEYVMQLNVFAPLALMQAVVRVMRRQTSERRQTDERRQTGEWRPSGWSTRRRPRVWRGVVVNVSSMIEAFPVPYMAGYGASKAALGYLSEAAAIELDRDDIAVVKLTPGLTATGFERHTRMSGQGASLEQLLEQASIIEAIPAERVAQDVWMAVQAGQTPRPGLLRDRLMLFAGRWMPGVASAVLKVAVRRYVLPGGAPSQTSIGKDLRSLGLRTGAAAGVALGAASAAWLWWRKRRPRAS